MPSRRARVLGYANERKARISEIELTPVLIRIQCV